MRRKREVGVNSGRGHADADADGTGMPQRQRQLGSSPMKVADWRNQLPTRWTRRGHQSSKQEC